MVKWSCCSSLCFNSYLTFDENGEKLKFYRLPRDEETQRQYKKILKTEGINWKNGHICAEHWSEGERKNTSHFPDVPVPQSQLEKLTEKFNSIEQKMKNKSNPTQREREYFKKMKTKYELAVRLTTSNTGPPQAKRRKLVYEKSHSAPSPKPPSTITDELTRESSPPQHVEESEIEKLKKERDELERINNELVGSNYRMKHELSLTKAKAFSYDNLRKNSKKFHQMCGLDIEQFKIVYECVEPYLHLIPYPNLKNTGDRSLSHQTELLAVLTICRQGLRISVMAYLLDRSDTTVERIFNGWVIFLATVFNKINLKPSNSFLVEMMPKSFVETGHGSTDLVIDATEFKLQMASNYELNSLTFSNYKNHTTGKALIGIAPHGLGVLFSDVYPGSITDSEITDKSKAIDYVEEEQEIMSDRGFAIADLLISKGITLNRPKQKEGQQFPDKESSENFDVAGTRIHVERFIGRVRDWNILNGVWPMNRIDMLTSTWQMLCHVVNLTTPPIGPSE